MINENFTYLALLIGSIGGLSYLVATLQGKAKPNRVTWFLWALAPFIAFSAQIQEGVGISAFFTFIAGFFPLLIFLASFLNKKSEWKMTKFDLICGALSLMGIFFWYLTKSGDIAIWFSLFADGLAALPTIIKSYKDPESEDAKAYLLSAVAAGITLLTLRSYEFVYLGFPLYLFLLGTLLTIIIKFKIGKRVSL